MSCGLHLGKNSVSSSNKHLSFLENTLLGEDISRYFLYLPEVCFFGKISGLFKEKNN